MQTKGEIRHQVISDLTNVYTNTPGGGEEGAEVQPPWIDFGPEHCTINNVIHSYTLIAAMFIDFAMQMERRHDVSFLAWLQEQAMPAEDDDELALGVEGRPA